MNKTVFLAVAIFALQVRVRERVRVPSSLASLLHTVKICRHLTTKILTTFSSEENDDKPLSVDDTLVICDDRFVT